MTGYLKSLELDKIVEKAAGYAACPQAAALLRERGLRLATEKTFKEEFKEDFGISS